MVNAAAEVVDKKGFPPPVMNATAEVVDKKGCPPSQARAHIGSDVGRALTDVATDMSRGSGMSVSDIGRRYGVWLAT